MASSENGQRRAGPGGTGTVEIDNALSSRLIGALRDHAIIGLDSSGCVVSWTDAAARLTGYTAEDILGSPCDLFAPGDHGAPRGQILRAASETGTYRGENWWRRADGAVIRVEEVIHPLDGDGFVVVARDTAGRDAADQRLHASGAREAAGLDRERGLRTELQAADRRASFLAEASSILVATSLDFDSTVRALSRLAVSRLAEWCVIHSIDEQGRLVREQAAHRDPDVQARLDELLGETLSGAWEQSIRSVLDTGQAQQLEHAVDRSWFRTAAGAEDEELVGRLARGSVMATPLLGRGNVLGAITFVSGAGRDFGEDDLVLAEELGRRAAIALDNARLFREAQEANRAKADFLAVISHELRTPLNAIMGYSDLLDAEISGDLTDKQRRQIERIRASARHLLQLIEEILAFARIQSGGDELHLERLDAVQLMHEAAAVTEPMARARGLDFRLDLPASAVELDTDPGKTRQVLVNLLSNAVKFTDAGSVSLRLRESGERVIFEVADTGVGIPSHHLPRIYDPFWQAEHPNTRRAGGTGLGLSVSRRYARLLRGDLDVRSEPGRGSTFSLSLPVRFPARDRRPRELSREQS